MRRNSAKAPDQQPTTRRAGYAVRPPVPLVSLSVSLAGPRHLTVLARRAAPGGLRCAARQRRGPQCPVDRADARDKRAWLQPVADRGRPGRTPAAQHGPAGHAAAGSLPLPGRGGCPDDRPRRPGLPLPARHRPGSSTASTPWLSGLAAYAGRILRLFPGKATAEMHDYHDTPPECSPHPSPIAPPGTPASDSPTPAASPTHPVRAAREIIKPPA